MTRNKVSNACIAKAVIAQNRAQMALSDTIVYAATAAKIAEGTIASEATKATVASASKALDKEIMATEALQEVDNSLDS